MLLEELFEMTMTFGKAGHELDNAMKAIFDDRINYIHVGDIQRINVFHKGNIYLLTQNDSPIGFFQVIPTNGVALIQNMYVIPEERKKGIMSMFLFFLKRNESYRKIQLGSQHTTDTIEAVKRIHKRFNTYWEKDGQREPYDPKTINNFYSPIKPTGWNIILENDGDFSDWPKFWDHTSPIPDIRNLYESLLD